jgi:citrate synthase
LTLSRTSLGDTGRRNSHPRKPRDGTRAAKAAGNLLAGILDDIRWDGHRIYKTRDPRADALKAAVRRLHELPSAEARLEFAEAVEQEALTVLRAEKPGRALDTNVEFFTALLLEAAGYPPEAFTCIFAAGRIAHAREQRQGGRLIRPQSSYVWPSERVAA